MYILVNQKTINYQIYSKRIKDNLRNRLEENMTTDQTVLDLKLCIHKTFLRICVLYLRCCVA